MHILTDPKDVLSRMPVDFEYEPGWLEIRPEFHQPWPPATRGK